MPSPKYAFTRRSVFVAIFFVLLLTSQLSFGFRRYPWISPSSPQINFGARAVGSKVTLPEVLTNTSQYPLTITGATVYGTGFAVNRPPLPFTLNPGASVTMLVIFAPTSGSAYNGTLSVAGGRYGRKLNVPVVGNGTGAGSISALPSSLGFGTVAVGSSTTKTASLSVSGSSAVISSITTTNPEFTVSGLTLPLTLTLGKTISFAVKFAPQSAGSASAKLAFVTGATGSVASQILSGTGSAAASKDHSVSLSWQDGVNVAGYNVYRAAKSGGPYTKVNPAKETIATYTDTTVVGGATYFYVVTSVSAAGMESAHSQEVVAAVPST